MDAPTIIGSRYSNTDVYLALLQSGQRRENHPRIPEIALDNPIGTHPPDTQG